eukprot:m.170070 g.170070  ORF g.170070 m.170070 type:complete len:570 (+) comp10375_c0_seq6:4768-6477(+)
MCGIACLLVGPTCDAAAVEARAQNLELLLRRRGPDAVGRVWCGPALLVGCVLHLRGPLTHQPICDVAGNALLWNGEAYSGVDGLEKDANDGACVLEALVRRHTESGAPGIAEILSRLRGPWAFVFYAAATHELWFGRDYFGRRSLLWQRDEHRSLVALASAALARSEPGWEELPADGLYSVALRAPTPAASEASAPISRIAWGPIGGTSPLCSPLAAFNRQLPPEGGPCTSGSPEHCDDGDEPAHRSLPPPLPVAGSDPVVLAQFLDVLKQAVARRVTFCITDSEGAHAVPPVGVLYSGGVDSTVLAALASKSLPAGVPIELINVAFSNPRIAQANDPNEYNVPDRISGRKALEDLCAVAPDREFILLEVNVPRVELEDARASIHELVAPLSSVMDESIGLAIWFAARGSGIATSCQGTESRLHLGDYSAKSKILLVGMGADEQLAGYSRHRTRFNHDGWQGVISEVALDIGRISSRNLGRDDRCVSDHAREARFPFLDEDLVSFLNALRIDQKTNFQAPRGVGEKQLLRTAADHLGLHHAAGLAKRAIQFGSRIAKMDSGRQTGIERF